MDLPLGLPDGWTAIAMPDADVRVWEQFLAPDAADTLMAALHRDTPWRQDDITLFGKRVAQPRLHAWYGDPDAVYTYSGLRNTPLPWTPMLQALRARVEAACGCPFNSVLLNLYRDGQDSMGMHADDEPELGVRPVIASLSLGAARHFILHHRSRADAARIRLLLPNGCLLLMGGDTQTHWKHAINKSRTVTAPRINLTFRQIKHK